MPHSRDLRAAKRKRALSGFVIGTALGLAACSDLLNVSAPDVVQPNQIADAGGATILTNAALACIYAPFATLAYYSGIMSDEFNVPTTLTIVSTLDYRTQSLTYTEFGPVGLGNCRTQAMQAMNARRQFAPTPNSLMGQLFAVRGLSEMFLGETSCDGTPASEIVNLQPVYGGPITSDSMLKRAQADLDSALTYATDSVRVLNYVKIALGRTLLDRGLYSQAAAAVAGVPTNYTYNAEFSTAVSGQSNTVWSGNIGKSIAVSDKEGINGLPFVSANDPRVPTQKIGIGTDNVTPVYLYTKYTSLSSPIPLATGIEARLIEAENYLSAGDVTNWLGTLNALRAPSGPGSGGVAGLAPLVDPGTTNGRVNLLFSERAFWLFATAHRMGDLRRLVRQYKRDQGTVWPTGVYKSGFNYGTDVVFILTLSEQSNPLVHYCTDTNA